MEAEKTEPAGADDPTSGELEGQLRDALMERPGVVFAYLFGSRAEGAARRSSDVDVAVYLREGAGASDDAESDEGKGESSGEADPLDAWTEIHGDVVRSLGSERGRRTGDLGGAPEGVDLVLLNRAPPLLADRVARSGRLLFSRDEPERIRWIVRTKSRYCDLRFMWKRLDQTVQDRIRSGHFGGSSGQDEPG